MSLYNIPGKLIAELWYLWPKKGQIWASGRRRSHTFVHFLYSTIFYGIIGFGVWLYFVDNPKTQEAKSQDNLISLETKDSYTFERNSNGAVIKGKRHTIYIGNSCDAFSKELGSGNWFRQDNEVHVELSSQSFRFPASNLSLLGCFRNSVEPIDTDADTIDRGSIDPENGLAIQQYNSAEIQTNDHSEAPETTDLPNTENGSFASDKGKNDLEPKDLIADKLD